MYALALLTKNIKSANILQLILPATATFMFGLLNAHYQKNIFYVIFKDFSEMEQKWSNILTTSSASPGS